MGKENFSEYLDSIKDKHAKLIKESSDLLTYEECIKFLSDNCEDKFEAVLIGLTFHRIKMRNLYGNFK